MSGIGSVAIISTRAGASGSQTPSMSANAPVCGPAAITTTSAPNVPRVVSIAVTRPPRWLSPATVVRQRRRVRLYGARRVGVTAEVQVRATDRVVAHDRHQLLELPAIQQLPAEPARLPDLRPSPRERQLRLAERDADTVRLVFRGIPEQLVHLG